MAESQQPEEKEWPDRRMGRFLEALRNSANIRASCQASTLPRAVAYRLRNKSARFAAAWDDALEDAIDTLEAVAWQRARQQSDYLLWRLLAANRREKYGDVVKVTLDLEAEARRIAEREGLPPETASKIVELSSRLKSGKTG